jgi:hypothetical protein
VVFGGRRGRRWVCFGFSFLVLVSLSSFPFLASIFFHRLNLKDYKVK